MQNHKQSDRLSWGDTVFLHLEREGMPLNVASICLFEGEISLEDGVQFIESKLPLVPVISSASSPRRSVWAFPAGNTMRSSTFAAMCGKLRSTTVPTRN